MTTEYTVTNVFRLADGTTVIACAGTNSHGSIGGRIARLLARGIVRQKLVLSGEREMLKQTRVEEFALETRDEVLVSQEDVARGSIKLAIE